MCAMMNELYKICLLLAVISFTSQIYAQDSNNDETIDGSSPGQGIPQLLVNLFPNIDEEVTKPVTKKTRPFRKRPTFSNDVRIPPAFLHLYPDVFFRTNSKRVKRNLYTINFDEYVPSPLTDFYGLRARNEKLVQETTTENIVDTTTEILTTSSTTTRRPRRLRGRGRRPKDPAARARARQRLANRDQRIPPAFADLYPSPENGTLNNTYGHPNRTRKRPDFPSRIPPAFQHLYPEQVPTTSPSITSEEVTTTKKPRRRPDFPSRIPPAYQHLYPDPTATTTTTTSTTTLSPTTSETPIRSLAGSDTVYQVSIQTTNVPNEEQTQTTSIDTTPFLSSRSAVTTDESVTTITNQVPILGQNILTDLKNKVDNLLQLEENQANKQLSLEQRIIGIENILATKYNSIHSKINDILKQIVRLESQNNRLDSALYVLRKNSISIKHTLDSLVNTTSFEISREISQKMDLVSRTVEVLRNEIKQSSTLHFKRSAIINSEGDGNNYYAIETEGNLLPKNCLETQNKGLNKSDVYRIYPLQSSLSFFVFCNNGWTVIQNRNSGKINFTRTWDDYKLGFGNIEEEFWLGLEKIHILTNYDKVELMIELEDFNSVKTYAHYDSFSIGSEFEGYSLYLLGTYSGNAGDYLRHQVSQKFTTYDQNLENSGNEKCIGRNLGGWWTKETCAKSNLNGLFLNENNDLLNNEDNGIYWNNANGQIIKSSRMLIRPSTEN